MTLWKQVALTVHLVAQNLVKPDAEMPSSSSSISIFDLIWPSKFSRFGENLTSFKISFVSSSLRLLHLNLANEHGNVKDELFSEHLEFASQSPTFYSTYRLQRRSIVPCNFAEFLMKLMDVNNDFYNRA